MLIIILLKTNILKPVLLYDFLIVFRSGVICTYLISISTPSGQSPEKPLDAGKPASVRKQIFIKWKISLRQYVSLATSVRKFTYLLINIKKQTQCNKYLREVKVFNLYTTTTYFVRQNLLMTF